MFAVPGLGCMPDCNCSMLLILFQLACITTDSFAAVSMFLAVLSDVKLDIDVGQALFRVTISITQWRTCLSTFKRELRDTKMIEL